MDVNTTANRAYANEYGVQPRAMDLQRVTAAQLDALGADLWLLTPPCQPYTTGPNARRRDTADPRAASLLALLSPAAGLPAMSRPPARLLLENVPGFVGSGGHGALRAALAGAGYEVREFIVSPHQLGVPYSRPRYFALALRRPLRFPHAADCNLGPMEHPPCLGQGPGRLGATDAEVAALHGMPPGWADRAAAAGLSARQQYALLGNGLSVDVAAHLLAYLLADLPTE
ncbi:hypothetical protein GPECTOR_19g220 [Gonium pectorale]|uniref:DNA methyltransferase n=1 Tax=Gonium pectorale TaxID=33097 RepID=A0A150GIY1_GONPE|nr:hypothetical protein GPECTOR_19g220 [Gonium pectorale]|eukprot:KXZ49769.1 hypothetical protein GPECTOR_19g220 [Gonium pectorale]